MEDGDLKNQLGCIHQLLFRCGQGHWTAWRQTRHKSKRLWARETTPNSTHLLMIWTTFWDDRPSPSSPEAYQDGIYLTDHVQTEALQPADSMLEGKNGRGATAYFNINIVNWQVHETLAKVGNFNAAQQEIEKSIASCRCRLLFQTCLPDLFLGCSWLPLYLLACPPECPATPHRVDLLHAPLLRMLGVGREAWMQNMVAVVFMVLDPHFLPHHCQTSLWNQFKRKRGAPKGAFGHHAGKGWLRNGKTAWPGRFNRPIFETHFAHPRCRNVAPESTKKFTASVTLWWCPRLWTRISCNTRFRSRFGGIGGLGPAFPATPLANIALKSIQTKAKCILRCRCRDAEMPWKSWFVLLVHQKKQLKNGTCGYGGGCGCCCGSKTLLRAALLQAGVGGYRHLHIAWEDIHTLSATSGIPA